MTWIQVVAGWALSYTAVSFICGCFMWEAQGEFWKGFCFGLAAVTLVLAVVTLALLAYGWLPS